MLSLDGLVRLESLIRPNMCCKCLQMALVSVVRGIREQERVRKRGKRWSNMNRKGKGGKRKASGINYAVCLH